jgi:osmotically-inducible protein OsmY
MRRSLYRLSWRIAYLGTILGGIVWAQTPAIADAVRAQSAIPLETIVVTAKRRPEVVPDEELTKRVEAVLHDDPYFYDEYVTVTVKNGVATLQGIVFDEWDLRQAIRLAKRISGVKRVVNDLEIKLGGE